MAGFSVLTDCGDATAAKSTPFSVTSAPIPAVRYFPTRVGAPVAVLRRVQAMRGLSRYNVLEFVERVKWGPKVIPVDPMR